MELIGQMRPSNSPLVETVWWVRSEKSDSFTSIAAANWELVFAIFEGQITLSIRGPESRASRATCPPNTEFLGISFKLGAFLPQMPTLQRVDRDFHVPLGTAKTFCLGGLAWEIPTYENADDLILKLIQTDTLLYDSLVDVALQNQIREVSLRTVQRRILNATGLTHSTILQIQRARHAMELLQNGHSILDTVFAAGYADQPHLTRALKRYVGQTPAQLRE